MPGTTTAFQTGVHGSRPAASAGCIHYSCTTHSLIYQSDGATWTTWATLGTVGGVTVASDTIWDAAGDLAVGSGADTAAKLSIGAVGSTLGRINGAVAWNGGTSFPGSKATSDRFFRSDLALEFYWDGAQWLSTQIFTASPSVGDTLLPNGTDTTAMGRMPVPYVAGGTDLWLVSATFVSFVSATNNGSLFWTIALQKTTAGNVSTTVASRTTAADTQANWTRAEVSIGALLGGVSTYKAMQIFGTKNSTPGSIYATCQLAYRIVAT